MRRSRRRESIRGGLRGALTSTVAGDPRYPYGAAGGSPFNADNPKHTCPATLSIPDPYTGQFDGIGAFREPAQLLGHLQLSYQISPASPRR